MKSADLFGDYSTNQETTETRDKNLNNEWKWDNNKDTLTDTNKWIRK